MTEQPLVSVVIATYNMGQYLVEAVDSVLAQTWKNLEVIVVDDGSEDDTKERMFKYRSDQRVTYIRTDNLGQPKAKNLGIKQSLGKFVAFCDADDYWSPEKLRLQMPLFNKEKIGIVYSEVSYIDGNGEEIKKPIPYQRYDGNITKRLIIKNFIPFGTAVVRKECFEKLGLFDEKLPMGIDWDLWLRFSISWEFKYLPKSTYVYRVWPGQMSKNYRGRYENAIKILENFINENPGVVPKKLEARAWSDMYASKAISLARSEKVFLEPLKDACRSLRHDFTYIPAWKSLAKLLLWRI